MNNNFSYLYINISDQISFCNHNKPKTDELTQLFLSDTFSIDDLLYYIAKKSSQSVVDMLVNLLSQRYIKETLFYLPELCDIMVDKSYTQSLEDFVLSLCVNHLKFVMNVFWIMSSFAEETNNEFALKFLPVIEMTLVNGKKRNEIAKEEDVFKENILKQYKFNYFNHCIKFYKDIKLISEKLRRCQREKRNTFLKLMINALNKRIKGMYSKEEGIEDTNDEIKGMYRGIVLPFDDCDSFTNRNSNIILNFISDQCYCISTKARVPIRLIFECANVEDCANWNVDRENERYVDNEFASIEDFLENFGSNCGADLNRRESLGNFKCDLGNPFGEPWSDIVSKNKSRSIYSSIPSYNVKAFIAKSNDDLRQESLTMQILKIFDKIFKQNEIPLKIRTYDIIITSLNSGLIEYIPNTISIDALKKKIGNKIDFNTFFRIFFADNFEEAQKNFCESLAAYSLITYILNIKDRHNGNILLDMNGKIIHIDFGFILGLSPGGMNFESAPFKLTKDYIDILDGENSNMFHYYKTLIIRGFLALKQNFDSIIQIVEIMSKVSNIPCFYRKDGYSIIKEMRKRFLIEKNESEIEKIVDDMINTSNGNWRTYQYDRFQKLTNDIEQ